MFEVMCAAQDKFIAVRAAYYRGESTYEEMYAAAVEVLTLRIAAEVKRFGKAKTKITAQSIASFMRG